MVDPNAPMPVAVIGVGRMGKHHVRTYARLAGARLVAVVDGDQPRAETVADECGCAAYDSIDPLLDEHEDLRAVSVAVPTRYHAAVAAPLLEQGIACLVEKPLASSVADAHRLVDVANATGTVLQVGHTERFNPAVRAVAAMDLTPRFMEIDRVSPMSFRSLDVGVVMDMMIHDLDIVLMLARSPIKRIEAAGVAVISNHEDVANARVVFENGCVANIKASRLALKTERKLRVFSETAYVSLDYQKRSGVVIRKSENQEALAKIREQLESGADLTDVDYSAIVRVDELTMDLPPNDPLHDPLTAELSSFLDTVRSGDAPLVDAAAGYAAVDAAERVVASLNAHRWEGRAGLQL